MVAVGHKILIAVYHILKNKEPYKELGSEYLIKLKEGQSVKHHCKQLEKLGYAVEVQKNK